MKKQLLPRFECLESQFIPWAGRKGWSKAHWSWWEGPYWLHWVLVQPLWNRIHTWVYAVIIFQQSRRPLPLQELVSLPSKTTRHTHAGRWLYSAAVLLQVPTGWWRASSDVSAWHWTAHVRVSLWKATTSAMSCVEIDIAPQSCRCLLMRCIQALQNSPFAAGVMQSLFGLYAGQTVGERMLWSKGIYLMCFSCSKNWPKTAVTQNIFLILDLAWQY